MPREVTHCQKHWKQKRKRNRRIFSLQMPHIRQIHRQSNVVPFNKFAQRAKRATTFQTCLHQSFAGRHKRFTRITPEQARVNVLRKLSNV